MSISTHRDDRTAIVARTQDVVTTNPVMFTDLTSASIATQVFEHLLTLDPQLRYVADTMTATWNIAKGGDSVEFDLRPGMTFHDGVPVTADDAVFTFTEALDPANCSPRRAQLLLRGQPMEFVAEDAHRLRVVLPEDSAACLSAIGGLPLLPRHLYQGNHTLADHPMNMHPVGSGPFMFEHWNPGHEIVLRAYPGYYGEQARIERVSFRVYDDVETAVDRLMAGHVDYVPGVPTDLAREIASLGATVRWNDAAMVTYLALNVDAPQLHDVRTRRAIAHAIDREALVASAVGGAGVVADTLVPPGSYWRNTSLTPLEYNVRTAATLLDESGFTYDSSSQFRRNPMGETFTLEILALAGDRAKEAAATRVAHDLRAVGIQAFVRTLPLGELLYKRVYPREYDASVMAVNPDPDPGFLATFYHSEMLTPVGWNRFGYCNAIVDRLLDSSSSLSLPRAERKASLDRVQTIVAADVPHVTLFNPVLANALSDRIIVPKELAPHGDDFKSLRRWRWAKA